MIERKLYREYPPLSPEFVVEPEELTNVSKSGLKGKLRGLFYKNRLINGIPYFESGGKSYPALAIIPAYALCNYNNYLKTKNQSYKEEFLNVVAWLEKNFVEKDNYGYWETLHPIKGRGYHCKPPFISSLAQGLSISTLSRAYLITNNNAYLNLIEKTLNIYDIKVSDGGILEIDEAGNYWYEEYPNPKRPTHVLNGMIFSLIGPYDYYMITGNKKAKLIFDRGIKTLKKHLQDYELNLGFLKWSRYDSYKMFYASQHYHSMHIAQLKYLYEITNDEVLLEYYNKWSKYQKVYGPMINVIDLPISVLFKIMKVIGV